MKKGFTLIELVITIGLLAIIGTVLVANIGNVLANQQDTQYEEFVSTIENAACTYIEKDANSSIRSSCKSAGSCPVTVGNVLSQGLLEDSDLINPQTGETISESTTVTISYTDGVKSCHLNI